MTPGLADVVVSAAGWDADCNDCWESHRFDTQDEADDWAAKHARACPSLHGKTGPRPEQCPWAAAHGEHEWHDGERLCAGREDPDDDPFTDPDDDGDGFEDPGSR